GGEAAGLPSAYPDCESMDDAAGLKNAAAGVLGDAPAAAPLFSSADARRTTCAYSWSKTNGFWQTPSRWVFAENPWRWTWSMTATQPWNTLRSTTTTSSSWTGTCPAPTATTSPAPWRSEERRV